MTVAFRRASKNLYRDLGFPPGEAANLRIRSDLMIHLRELIEERGLTQAAAAALFEVTQPRISDLVRGRIDRFSIDTLVAMLSTAGVRVGMTLRGGGTRLAPGLRASRGRARNRKAPK